MGASPGSFSWALSEDLAQCDDENVAVIGALYKLIRWAEARGHIDRDWTIAAPQLATLLGVREIWDNAED